MAEETTTQDNHIKPISEATQTNLLANSVWSLPNNPSELGYSADEIKSAFYKPFIDWEGSLLAEVRRVITEANAAFYALESDTEAKIDELAKGTVKKTEKKNILYGTNTGGECTYPISAYAALNAVPLRDSNGRISGVVHDSDVSDVGTASTIVKRDSEGKIAGVVNNIEVDKEALAKLKKTSGAVSLNESFQVNGDVKITGNLDLMGDASYIDTDVMRVDAPINMLNTSVLDTGKESDWVNGGTALLLSNGKAFGTMYNKSTGKLLFGLGTVADGKFSFDDGYKQVVGCVKFNEKAIPAFDSDGNLSPSEFNINSLKNIDTLSKTSLQSIEAKAVDESSGNSTFPYLQVKKANGSKANVPLDILSSYFPSLQWVQNLDVRVEELENKKNESAGGLPLETLFKYFASLTEFKNLVSRVSILETLTVEYVEDDSVSRIKQVPSGIEELALVIRMGGMTYRRDDNLFPDYKIAVWKNHSFSGYIKTGSYTHSGLNFEFYTDGSIKVDGTAGKDEGGGYSFSIIHSPNADGTRINDPVYLDGTYTFGGLGFGKNTELRLVLELDDGRTYRLYDTPITFTHTGYVNALKIYFSKGNEFKNRVFKPILIKGDKIYCDLVDAKITGIKSDIDAFYLPEELPEFYNGKGVSSDCCNYIDCENGTFTRKVHTLEFQGYGAEAWTIENCDPSAPDHRVFIFTWTPTRDTPSIESTPSDEVPKCICNLYSTVSWQEGFCGKEGVCAQTTEDALGPRFYVFTSRFRDIDEFKLYLYDLYKAGTPLTATYAIAEPEESKVEGDLSMLLKVTTGGKVEAVVEAGDYDVPYTIAYAKRKGD